MTKELKTKIKHLSDYPPAWGLSEKEVENMVESCNKGLATTNGDTSPVTLTVRELLLLLRYVK